MYQVKSRNELPQHQHLGDNPLLRFPLSAFLHHSNSSHLNHFSNHMNITNQHQFITMKQH